MLRLHECLLDIAQVSNAPIAWLAPHKPILALLERHLTYIDIMSLHGAFEDFVDGVGLMSKQYWSMSFDPAVRHMQNAMLRHAGGRIDILRAMYYAGWASKVLDRERVMHAIESHDYDAVEFYAEMFCVRNGNGIDMKCFKHIDAKMVNSPHMRALMMRMPKQLLERIAVKFMETCDGWLYDDILAIVDTADYHLLHTFGCDVDTSSSISASAHEYRDHGDSTLYQYKRLTTVEEQHKNAVNTRPGAFETYSWVPEFARRVKELAAAGQLNLKQTYVQHDDDITTQYSVQHIREYTPI